MNKNEFLNLLRNHLSFLEKKDLEKEIFYFTSKIDHSTLTEGEVIKSFGKIEDIVKEIQEKYDGKSFKSLKKENVFKQFYNNLIELSFMLKNSDGKEKISILTDIILLIFVTCILKIPFIFIRDLGDRVTEVFFSSNVTILAIWGLIIEILYVILSLTFFIKTFDKWYENRKK